MSISQSQVDQYLSDVRTKGQEATATFGSDSSKITKHEDGRVTVTLYFYPPGNSPSEVAQAENAATAAAEQLRGLGADVKVHTDDDLARTICVFDAP